MKKRDQKSFNKHTDKAQKYHAKARLESKHESKNTNSKNLIMSKKDKNNLVRRKGISSWGGGRSNSVSSQELPDSVSSENAMNFKFSK